MLWAERRRQKDISKHWPQAVAEADGDLKRAKDLFCLWAVTRRRWRVLDLRQRDHIIEALTLSQALGQRQPKPQPLFGALVKAARRTLNNNHKTS